MKIANIQELCDLGGFVSFLVKFIKVFWILFLNQPVHKPQIIN